MWELSPMFPHRHETHAVNLFNITRLHHFRIAPNGSRKREAFGPLFFYIYNCKSIISPTLAIAHDGVLEG